MRREVRTQVNPLDAAEMGNVVDALDIDWKVGTGDDWERIGGTESDISQTFYYKKIVAKDSDVTDKGNTVKQHLQYLQKYQ